MQHFWNKCIREIRLVVGIIKVLFIHGLVSTGAASCVPQMLFENMCTPHYMDFTAFCLTSMRTDRIVVLYIYIYVRV